MKAAERLGIRTRSREFIEARIQRLILDTLYKYGHLSVLSDHAVELIREESEQEVHREKGQISELQQHEHKIEQQNKENY